MKKLQPILFKFGNYDSTLIPHKTFLSGTKLFAEWLETQDIKGYCKSEEVDIRPRPDNYCVMFKEDNWTGWCHVPNFVFDRYLENMENING